MLINQHESLKILKKYGIKYPKTVIFRENNVKKLNLKFPVALKVDSNDVIHKSDMKLVKINIVSLNELNSHLKTFHTILRMHNIKNYNFIVQEMITGQEFIIGMKKDATFGNVLVFGVGGIFTEILKDISMKINPITKKDAKDMINEIKSQKLLSGFRGSKPVNKQKLIDLLLKFSKLVNNEKNIDEIDFNPVIVNEKDAIVVDARLIGGKMFEQFFNPKSIAIIGASRKKNSAGQGIVKSLLKGGVFNYKTNRPFKGKIYPINPKADSILGLKCYSSILNIKAKIDLVIIVVPAKIVKFVMTECAKKKVKSVIIISAGFGEIGHKGQELENEIITIAKKASIRIIGPNCLGLMRPSSNLNASFGPCMPNDGNIAFFSQSGALIDSVIDWSLESNYGFSSVVSMGNKADIDVSDLLLWAANDKKTKAITLYLEGIKDGKKFMKVAKKVSKIKPIIALKSGRGKTGIKAVSSHTGSLAGSYEVYKAAFRQSGVIVAENVDELFEMADALSQQPPCKNNIAIITNGGGAGVLCADYCEELGINLVKLSESTLKKLDATGKMHPAYSRNNPLDLVGDALSDRYTAALDIVLNQKDVHGLIVIQTLQTMTQPILDARAVIKARKKYPDKPIITSYMGGKFTRKAVELLESNHVPDFNVPYKAAKAMSALIKRNKYLS